MALSYRVSSDLYKSYTTYEDALAQATRRAQKHVDDVTIYVSVATVGMPKLPIEVKQTVFDPTVNMPKSKEAKPASCSDDDEDEIDF